MFISAIQELSFHRKTGVTLKWRTRFLLCVEQCSKDSILLMCVECIPALYPYGNSWVVGKALWHIKTRHHQDFHLDDAWFMFSNPVRQMPYISNFRGLLFYDHPSNRAACILEKLLELYALTNRIGYGKLYALCGVAGQFGYIRGSQKIVIVGGKPFPLFVQPGLFRLCKMEPDNFGG